EVAGVAREHLAGVEGATAGESQRPGDGDAGFHDRFARPRELAVAAGFRGHVHDDAARAHAPDHAGGEDARRRTTGHRGGADHRVHATQVLTQPALLFRALLVGELARVTAL